MSFRVLLIYPPASQNEQGAGKLSSERMLVPYGLLTIAAHLRQHGFEADVINLHTFTWQQALDAIRRRPADLFGLSCRTIDRHATAALGAEIKAIFPESHVTVGGPHVSILPHQWLAHYPFFDTVVIGEGELTALELASRLRAGEPADGIPGTAYRVDGVPTLGPAREFVAELDTLGKPWKHFDYFHPVTSRGCPAKCAFCSTPTVWGRRIRFRSAENVLEELDELVTRRGHHRLAIVDDAFTADKKRALAICRGIVQRGLEFWWTCDTRVDFVNREILAAMRRAGCIGVQYGVESGSPEILRNINKRADLAQVLKATAEAKEVGLRVHFHLMLGNLGETPVTIRETMELIEKTRPTQFSFNVLTAYPGTEVFTIAQQQGLFCVEDYFTDPRPCFFCNLGEKSPEMGQLVSQLKKKLVYGTNVYAPHTTIQREQILGRYPDMLLSYTDLATSYWLERRFDDAEQVLHRAASRLGRQTPSLLQHLAHVELGKGEVPAAQEYLRRALEAAPENRSVRNDVKALHAAARMDAQRRDKLAAQLFASLTNEETYDMMSQPAVPMPLKP